MAKLPGGQKTTTISKVKQKTLKKAQGGAKPAVQGSMKNSAPAGRRGMSAKNAGMY